MKYIFLRPISLLFAMTFLIFTSCKKTTMDSSENAPIHLYGVNTEVDPVMYANVPVYKFAYAPTTNATIPASYQLETPDVRNQGSIGSCTGFCGAEANEILYYYKNGAWTDILSPAFLYYIERVKILNQPISFDRGAYMVNIPQALQGWGICKETSYPYPSSSRSKDYKTAPSAAAMNEALNYRIGQNADSYSVINTGDVASVKQLLLNNQPVMMGFNVYDNSSYQYFERLNTTYYTYDPLTANGNLKPGVRLLGGHATPIIGYDDNVQAFIVQNSWGTSWGNLGFYLMPYSVFSSTKIVPAGNCYVASL